MTLSMSLNWKAPDSSQLVNLRLKDVAAKGFVSGGEVTKIAGVLQVNVAPFVCINFDGAVVRSSENVVLNPGDGTSPPSSAGINVIVLRSRYVPLGSPVMSIQVMPVGSYVIDPEIDWLTVLAIVDLSVGAPHSEVAPDEILYSWTNGIDTIERNAVDPQARSFFRSPVENSGDLFTPGSQYLPPLADNRNGDVRLAVDTGSFYWWNALGSNWEIFDEVPLNMHREHEHTNGITGDSATTTLEPTASGTTVNVAVVPLGSGYTVNGRYVTAPSPALPFSRDLTVGGLFGQQGLIQASSTEFGVVDVEDAGLGDYRVKLDPGAPLAIAAVRIVDINEAHSLGLYALRFDAADGLSWDNGEPVDVGVGTATGGRYRLYGPEYINWIDVELTAGAILPALASDTYEVFASKKNDEHLLIAYFWWNGTAVVLGADKRYFGNLGAQELSDDFKASLTPAWNDLRGTMVYSGGDVSTTITPFVIQVTGPLVAYVAGVRKVVPISFGGQDGYTGLLLTASATSYLYVDSAGVFQVSTTVPTASDATVARVVCSGAGVTLIEDQRDPQIIVGQATRNSKLVFSETTTARWHEPSSALNLEKNGDATGTQMYAGTFFAKDNQFIATGHVQLVNDAVSDTPVTDALHDEIRKYQPPTGRDASLVGAIADGQEAQRFGFGCIGANACPVSFGTDSVVIGVGTFYDFSGRKVVISSPVTIDVSTLSAGTYDVYWHSELNSGYGGFDVGGVVLGITRTHGFLEWRSKLAFGVLDRTSGSNTGVTQCQMYATGSTCQEEFSIGADAGVVSGFGRGGNFSTLRKALVFRVCYSAGGGSDTYNAPRRFAVYDQIDEGANLIDFSSFEFVGLADDHLDGLHVYGSSVTATTVNRGILRWGVDGAASAVPMIDFRGQINSIKFSDLRLEYNGDTGVDNENCWIKNPGQNLVVENCGFAPQTGVGQPLRCLVRYDVTTSLGGTTTSLIPSTLFKNCNFINIVTSSLSRVLSLETTISGSVAFENCVFAGSYSNVIAISSALSSCSAYFSKCNIEGFFTSLISSPAGVTGKFVVSDSIIKASQDAVPFTGTFPFICTTAANAVDITSCTIADGLNLTGSNFVVGCKADSGVTVVVPSTVKLIGCDFASQNDILLSAPGAFDINAGASSTISTSSGSLTLNAAGSLNLGTSTGAIIVGNGGGSTTNLTLNASTAITAGSISLDSMNLTAENINLIGPVSGASAISILGQDTNATFSKVVNIGNEGKAGSSTSILFAGSNDGDTVIQFAGTFSDAAAPKIIERDGVRLVNSGTTTQVRTTSVGGITGVTSVLNKEVLAGIYKVEGLVCYNGSGIGSVANVSLRVDAGTFTFASLMFFISDKSSSPNESVRVTVVDALDETPHVEGQASTGSSSADAKMVGFMGTISITDDCTLQLRVSCPDPSGVSVTAGTYLEVIGVNLVA